MKNTLLILAFTLCLLVALTACSRPDFNQPATPVDVVQTEPPDEPEEDEESEEEGHPEDLTAPIDAFVKVFSDFFTTTEFNIVEDEDGETKKALVPLTEFGGLMQVTTYYDTGYEYLFQFKRDVFPDANDYVFDIIKTLSQRMDESDRAAVLDGMEKAKENLGTKYYLQNFDETIAYVSVQADEKNIYILLT